MQIYSKKKKIASSPSFLDRFSFCLFYLIGLGGLQNLYTKFSKLINYANLCKCIQNHNNKKSQKNASSPSFLNQFWFGLLYLVGTLNFYTELWDFAPLINYGNLCKFIPKVTKIASSSFLYRFSFCLFYLIGLGGGFKTCTQNFKIH